MKRDKKLGRKFDTEKPRWDLLPIEPIEEAVEVLTLGAKKYGDNNWKYVEPYRERYFSALMRHLMAWRKGELRDSETGKTHLAHALCCLMFLMYREKYKKIT